MNGSESDIKLLGIDCATPLSAEDASNLFSLGYRFVCRYLVPSTYPKHLSSGEARILSDAGLLILSVYETTAKRALGGSIYGHADGNEAYRLALELDMPFSSCIVFAVDFDAAAKDMDTIASYLKAAGEQLQGYLTGVYGSFSVVETMKARDAADVFWQTFAWSAGKLSKSASLYQYKVNTDAAGINVDIDEVYDTRGFWNYQGGNAMTSEAGNTPSSWAKDAVEKAKAKDILIGDENGDLKLRDPVTREALMVILDRLGLLS